MLQIHPSIHFDLRLDIARNVPVDQLIRGKCAVSRRSAETMLVAGIDDCLLMNTIPSWMMLFMIIGKLVFII